MSSLPPPPPPPRGPSDAPRPGYQAPSYPSSPPGAYGAPSYGSAPAGAPPSGPAYGGYHSQAVSYAGFWQRLGANLLDGLLMSVMMVPLIGPAVFFVIKAFENCDTDEISSGQYNIRCGPGQLKAGMLAIGVALALAAVILGLVWYCRRLGRGQTPGQKAVGIAVVDATHGGPIGTGRAVGRTFARYISGLPCYLGYLWMLWDQRKQTFHDKIVGSVVVRQ